MSSRIRSQWGSLGARGAASGLGGKVALPCHVWVWATTPEGESSWSPALLLRWEPDGAGGWLGEVALEAAPGLAARTSVPANRLRPAHTDPPPPWG